MKTVIALIFLILFGVVGLFVGTVISLTAIPPELEGAQVLPPLLGFGLGLRWGQNLLIRKGRPSARG